jgi:hypothetical protein
MDHLWRHKAIDATGKLGALLKSQHEISTARPKIDLEGIKNTAEQGVTTASCVIIL